MKNHEKNEKINQSMITYFLFSFKDRETVIHFSIPQNSFSRLDDVFSVSRSLSSKTLEDGSAGIRPYLYIRIERGGTVVPHPYRNRNRSVMSS